MTLTIAAIMAGSTALAAVLVLDPKYDDGVVGRLALFIIMLAGGLGTLIVIAGAEEVNPKLVAIFMGGSALFMARHVYRYMRFRFCGAGAWQSNRR